jgi:hypothetical protein
LAIVVAHHKAGVLFLDGPGWREAASLHQAAARDKSAGRLNTVPYMNRIALQPPDDFRREALSRRQV